LNPPYSSSYCTASSTRTGVPVPVTMWLKNARHTGHEFSCLDHSSRHGRWNMCSHTTGRAHGCASKQMGHAIAAMRRRELRLVSMCKSGTLAISCSWHRRLRFAARVSTQGGAGMTARAGGRLPINAVYKHSQCSRHTWKIRSQMLPLFLH